MRILITGSRSAIGRALVNQLLSDGHDVAIFLRSSTKATEIDPAVRKNPRFSMIEAPRTIGYAPPYAPAAEEIKKFQPEACVHLAWALTETKEARQSTDHLQYNYNATLELIQVLGQADCRYFVGLGSQDEYGQQNCLLTSELPPKPTSCYGVAKYVTGIASQKMCEANEMKHAWLRLTTAYGPYPEQRFFIYYVISQMLGGKTIEIQSPESLWDFIYIDDLTRAISLCTAKEFTGFHAIGSGEVASTRRIAEILTSFDPSRSKLKISTPKDSEPRYVRADVSELSRRLGWTPRTSLEQGLRLTWDWAVSAASPLRRASK